MLVRVPPSIFDCLIHSCFFSFFFSYYLTQKKTLEINPRHPLIKELLRRVEADPEDRVSKGMAMMMFQTGNLHCTSVIQFLTNAFRFPREATLRSGYMLQDPSQFAEHIDAMLKQSLGVGDAEIEEEEEIENVPEGENAEEEADQDNDEDEDKSSKDEL